MSPACSCRFLPRSHLCENIDCRRACPLLRMKGVHCGHVRSRIQDMFFAFELMPRHVKTDDAGQQRLNSVLDIVLRLSDATRGRNGLKFARLWHDGLQDSNKYSMGARLPHRCEVIVTCSSTELRQSIWLQVKVTFTELALVVLRFCSTGQTPRISVQFSKRNRTWKAMAGKAFVFQQPRARKQPKVQVDSVKRNFREMRNCSLFSFLQRKKSDKNRNSPQANGINLKIGIKVRGLSWRRKPR